ncbi:hypothetical protein M422DRAFT_273922 [Sphaerobolus stellatus SS14]|uniref:Uncharacterized protein n=1 Tax=Sphaerobolus stellatus (strain SS14) TaxID=990650 RepID=A0A0C9UIC4_SPHS4|nr:hypothetical protein M422DRAFT_273922 [Sphaerobolus stellatus SS14]
MVIDSINGTEYFYDLNACEDRNTWSEVFIESDSTEYTEDASKVEDSEELFQGNTDIEDEIKMAAEENIEQSKEDEEKFNDEYDHLVDSYVKDEGSDKRRETSNGRRVVPSIRVTGNTGLRNPTRFKEEHIYNWIELPFTMDGVFQPSLTIGIVIPAMCFNKYGECGMEGRLQISARNLSVRNYPSRQAPSGSDSARDSPSTHSSTPVAGEWEVWLETMVVWWRIYAHIVIAHE